MGGSNNVVCAYLSIPLCFCFCSPVRPDPLTSEGLVSNLFGLQLLTYERSKIRRHFQKTVVPFAWQVHRFTHFSLLGTAPTPCYVVQFFLFRSWR